MSKENNKTLKVYDKFAKTYLKQSVEHSAKDPEKAKKKFEWVKNFCKQGFETLPEKARILEIGAANGENSKMLEEFGFDVTASDVADDFLTAIKKQGLKTIKFNLLTDSFSQKYDGVFCWRVFVHFTKSDLELALNKIYRALNPNGRLIFNVINTESKENINKGWYDFPGEYHMGAERFFQHYDRSELIEIVEKAGFKIITIEKTGGKENNKWFCLALEKPDKVNTKIKEYVKENIFPDYDPHAGHGLPHINYVIRRSLNFAEQAPEVNIDMVYTIAAYHDIGRKVDNEHHEIESAKIFLNDDFMKDIFNVNERKLIAEAIEDHRASSKHEPRSIYGKIVSSADRNNSVEQILDRIYDYTKSLHPDFTEDEILADACLHLRKKYGKNGYASSKMFFHDPDYEQFMQDVEDLTLDPAKYAQMQQGFNRGKTHENE